MTIPSAHHDPEGNVTIQFGGLEPEDPQLGDFLRDLWHDIPHPHRDQDDPLIPSVLWIAWPHARRAVERLRATWPDAPVTAEANPNYGQAEQLAARLGEALAAVRAAEDAIRAAAPAGVR